MKLEAKQIGLSPKRVHDFICEAIEAERGTIDRTWAWWVGCSTREGESTK